jgi:hypothetical protein
LSIKNSLSAVPVFGGIFWGIFFPEHERIARIMNQRKKKTQRRRRHSLMIEVSL